MSQGTKAADLLQRFRALGGVADNVRLRQGPHGWGLFVIDPEQPVRVVTPAHLLITPQDLRLSSAPRWCPFTRPISARWVGARAAGSAACTTIGSARPCPLRCGPIWRCWVVRLTPGGPPRLSRPFRPTASAGRSGLRAAHA